MPKWKYTPEEIVAKLSQLDVQRRAKADDVAFFPERGCLASLPERSLKARNLTHSTGAPIAASDPERALALPIPKGGAECSCNFRSGDGGLRAVAASPWPLPNA